MAEQVDVFVTTQLEGIEIYVARELSDGTRDSEATVTIGNEKKIVLDGLEHAVIIKPPQGFDIKKNPLSVTSDIDLMITYSVWKGHYIVKVSPNPLGQDVPTTANVNVGTDRPD